MTAKVKSGKEVLDEFFSNLKNVKDVDPTTAEAIISLYNAGKLSSKNLSNALEVSRAEGGKDEDK